MFNINKILILQYKVTLGKQQEKKRKLHKEMGTI